MINGVCKLKIQFFERLFLILSLKNSPFRAFYSYNKFANTILCSLPPAPMELLIRYRGILLLLISKFWGHSGRDHWLPRKYNMYASIQVYVLDSEMNIWTEILEESTKSIILLNSIKIQFIYFTSLKNIFFMLHCKHHPRFAFHIAHNYQTLRLSRHYSFTY
jgi:hypothetical protein